MRNGPERKRPPYLPDGYASDETTQADLVILRREDGSEVAVFSATGADPAEVERAAWDDFGERPAKG